MNDLEIITLCKTLIRKTQVTKYDYNEKLIRDKNNKILHKEKQVFTIVLSITYLVKLLKKIILLNKKVYN